MSIVDTWNNTSTSDASEAPVAEEAATSDDGAAPAATSDNGLPRNVVLKVLVVMLAGVVWVVIGVGKVLLYGSGAAIFVVISLLEWMLQLLVMPFVLLLRATGASRWPVQINRAGKHFGTQYATDYAAAAALRDELAGRLEHGLTPAAQAPEAT